MRGGGLLEDGICSHLLHLTGHVRSWTNMIHDSVSFCCPPPPDAFRVPIRTHHWAVVWCDLNVLASPTLNRGFLQAHTVKRHPKDSSWLRIFNTLTDYHHAHQVQAHLNKHSGAAANGPMQHAHVQESAGRWMTDLPQTALAAKIHLQHSLTEGERDGEREEGRGTQRWHHHHHVSSSSSDM